MKTAILTAILLAPLAATAKGKTEDGRFQLIQLSDMRRDQFLLDTQTGKIWRRICFNEPGSESSDCDTSVWRTDVIEGITIDPAKLSAIIDKK